MEDDPLLGQLIVPFNKSLLKEVNIEESYDIVLIGFAEDRGCIENGGRAGANLAPDAVRSLLRKTGPLVNMELNIDLRSLSVADFGNVNGFHDGLHNVVKIISRDSIPIIIGGSNDQSFPNALGLMQNYPDLEVINIDAHLDVRPGMGHSGSPFRELILTDSFKGKLTEFACQGNQCSASHAQWALNHGVKIHWLSKINSLTFTKEIAAKDNGELFGSISITDVASFLAEQEISVEKKMIKLGEKIKISGNHKVEIDLHPEISCSLNIEILSPKSSL